LILYICLGRSSTDEDMVLTVMHVTVLGQTKELKRQTDT
jgi:hypothetical protein